MLSLLAGGFLFNLACSGGESSENAPQAMGEPFPDSDGESLPGDKLFLEGQLLEVAVTTTPEILQHLEEKGNDEVYQPAAVSITGTDGTVHAFSRVGFRHKGAWSLHHCWDDNGGVRNWENECAKLSFKIKFHEYDPDARLDGLKRLNLHGAAGDGTKMHDLLAYEAYRAAGVDAPRTTPVRLTINGEVAGLFIGVEAIDGRYTASHFPAGGDGNLYKETWPSSLGTEERFLDALRTNDEMPDVSDMLAFAEAMGSSTAENFTERLGQWTDLDQLLRYMAVDRALKNWDGVTAFYSAASPHNFYWYHHEGENGRFQLIPWDLDNTFPMFDPFMAPEQWVSAPPIPNWNSEPRDCEQRAIWEAESTFGIIPPRCDTLLDHLAELHWEEFKVVSEELLAGPLAAAVLLPQLDHWETVLAPLVSEDPTLDLSEWKRNLRELKLILTQTPVHFREFLDEGLVMEPERMLPPERVLTGTDTPTVNAGLHVQGPTNFEFSTPIDMAPMGVGTNAAAGTEVMALWNTNAPLAGSADLRVDFVFSSQPMPYDEWVDVDLGCAVTDVSAHRGVHILMRADSARTVRVRILSGAYEDSWAGIPGQFGVDVQLTDSPRDIFLDFSKMNYPGWARDSWATGSGFTVSDEEAISLALQSFKGLLFNPLPSWDSGGELKSPTESGFLQVDQLRFE